MNQDNFAVLKLPTELLKNITSLGYEKMTPIQGQSLPHILNGRDLIGQAKTGSGKTAAFGLGILAKLNRKKLSVQTLVLCPTRELADQVSQALRQLARTLPNIKILALCGGMPFRQQQKSLGHGAHIIVGTPGRVAKHLRKETLNLQDLTTLVLDEGDRMLDMGFQDEIEAIIDLTPTERQTLLFSATYPPHIQSMAESVMNDPFLAKVDTVHDEASIKQTFYKVDKDDRLFALQLLLQEHRPKSTVIFCNTKKDCREVTDELRDSGFSALDLHGDLEQTARDETLVQFANNSVAILVATDVAARGLDINSIDAVINYHISRDPEVHVHRIGRTGRAGNTGIACSLYSDKEHHKISILEEYIDQTVTSEKLPDRSVLERDKIVTSMTTIKIKKGKKQKVRAGNILGALTSKNGLQGDQVGKINVYDDWAYIAVKKDMLELALSQLAGEKLKGFSIEF